MEEKNAPLISVIVPVYRVEQYLDRCMNSIVNQTYRNLEIILVDDGSPDACPRICDEWAKRDERVKVIHKKNGGLGSARNAGLAGARGAYIGFVDSDDWIAPNMYEVLLNIIQKYNASISVGNIVRTDKELITLGKKSGTIIEYTQEQFARKFFRINSNEPVLYAVNKLYDIKVAENIHFPEGVIDEDVEGFFTALLAADKIVTIDIDLYYYWKNPNGISYKWFGYEQMDLLTVWKNIVELCKRSHLQWVEYAQLNYYRANMGLLVRLALNDRDKDILFENEKKKLVTELKKHKRELLKAPFPISRKLIVVMFCTNYNLTRYLMRKGKKFINISYQ